MCDAGRVLVNGRETRPAKAVKAGDVITLTTRTRIVELEVLSIPAVPQKTSSGELYRISVEKRIESNA